MSARSRGERDPAQNAHLSSPTQTAVSVFLRITEAEDVPSCLGFDHRCEIGLGGLEPQPQRLPAGTATWRRGRDPAQNVAQLILAARRMGSTFVRVAKAERPVWRRFLPPELGFSAMVLSPLSTLHLGHTTKANREEIEMLYPHVQYLGPAHPERPKRGRDDDARA